MADRTENDAVIELARSAAAVPRPVDGIRDLLEVVLPPEHTQYVVDLEPYRDLPRRKREHVELHEAASFAAYVSRHTAGEMGPEAPYALYADVSRAVVVAVLNDSAGLVPGWGDHRATLRLRPTKPWLHWLGNDGRLLSQEAFSEHIEAGLDEIVAPPALDMYELAQTFQATVGASFEQTGRLATGQRSLRYSETVNARAGSQGDIEIPKEFTLRLQPFEGSPIYDLVARLRFRIREAKLTLSYVLVRPDEVLKLAFDATLETIYAGTSIAAFLGTPPVRT